MWGLIWKDIFLVRIYFCIQEKVAMYGIACIFHWFGVIWKLFLQNVASFVIHFPILVFSRCDRILDFVSHFIFAFCSGTVGLIIFASVNVDVFYSRYCFCITPGVLIFICINKAVSFPFSSLKNEKSQRMTKKRKVFSDFFVSISKQSMLWNHEHFRWKFALLLLFHVIYFTHFIVYMRFSTFYMNCEHYWATLRVFVTLQDYLFHLQFLFCSYI